MTGNPSGFLTAHQSLAGLATVEYVDSSVSSKLDTSAFASASAGFAPTGDYAYNSSLSAYYPASASGAFQPSGQYQTAGDYALNSAVSSKLDATASSNFVVNSAMSSWIPYSALDYSGTAISGIGGSSLAGMGGGDYTGIYPVNVDNTAREISVDSLPLVTDSSMTAYGSAGSSVIGVNMDILTGKLDSSAQVVTATATQLYAGTAYLTGVNGAPVSASRAGQAANASLANSAWYDGTGRFISSLPDSATVSAIASAYATGKQDTLAFAYNTANQISSINGSALGGMDEAAVSGIASAYAESAASAKLDASASSSFYTTANPSGFITGVDLSPYQTTADMSGYIPTSLSSDFQQVTGMSSYALSADVSGTVDLVSTQSANWGGSALALSAGPGVKLEKVGNTLVVKADETLLWSGANTSAATLSEPYSNFERIGVVLGFPNQGKTYHVFEAASETQLMYPFGQTNAYLCAIKCGITDGTAFQVNDAKYVWSPFGTSTQVATDASNVASAKNCLVKIYGINRTAGV